MTTLCCYYLVLSYLFCSALSNVYTIQEIENGFELRLGHVKVLSHTVDKSAFYVGKGVTQFYEKHGNFKINNYVEDKIPLRSYMIEKETRHGSIELSVFVWDIKMTMDLFSTEENNLEIKIKSFPIGYDRMWIRLSAETHEHIFGGGEQFSYLNLRGHIFPIWTREQGVGRNKSDPVTFLSDVYGDGAGGDYHTTYFPLASFISSKLYQFALTSHNYAVLDFTHQDFHEIFILDRPSSMTFNFHQNSLTALLKKITSSSRQSVLPSWLSDGAIIGMQGGTEKMLDILQSLRKNGVSVNGLWIQDWSGSIKTSFGKRVFWNWRWDQDKYPNLDNIIKQLKEEGVKILVYINPHLNVEGDIFKMAETKKYLMTNSTGQAYVMDFGEFDVGTVDLTNAEAYNWYKELIKTDIVDMGISGWMADFSEYIPVDAVFHNGKTGRHMHNKFPVLWAQLNHDVVKESESVGECCMTDDNKTTADKKELTFFMRSGGAGTQKYCMLAWAGDQNVDFSLSDGLPSTIPAALSLGISGMGLTHFDIGGYTTVLRKGATAEVDFDFRMVRSEELFFRSAEMAVFTPVMRTHEGNIPDANFQVYTSDSSQRRFGVLVKMFKLLRNYTLHLMNENHADGIPLQRPLFLHYQHDEQSYAIAYQYLYGRDLLIAPVVTQGAKDWNVYFPPDDWVSIYDGATFKGPSWVTVNAPLGRPPVFHRLNADMKDTFQLVGRVAVEEYPHEPMDICKSDHCNAP